MKKFCAVTWNELVYSSQMNYSVCCKWQEHSKKNTASNKSSVEHYNSVQMKKLRKKFIQGKQINECKACWEDEDNGRFSMRMRRNQHYYGKSDLNVDDKEVSKVINDTGLDGSYNTENIHGLHISTGNKCQLRCIDCSPAYSRSILKDYEKLGWDKNFKARRHVSNNKVSEDEHWQSIKDNSQNLKIIRLTGGEPSINNRFIEYLNWCVDTGIAEKVMIHIPTNAVKISDSFLQPLKKFKKVMFSLSVDGVGELDEYLRYPTNWNKKIQNIEKIIDLFPDSNIHTVVYSLNVLKLKEIYEWGKKYPVQHSIELLTYPEELSVKHLPDNLKEITLKQIIPLVENISVKKTNNVYDKENYALNGLSAVVNRIKQQGSVDEWNKCFNIIKSYDTIRKKPLNKIIDNFY